MLHPPLNIRVVDCRAFGRYTLVGSIAVTSLRKFIYRPADKQGNSFSTTGLAKMKRISFSFHMSALKIFNLFPSEEIIVVGMENEPAYKKMDTVVKLDSVSFVGFLEIVIIVTVVCQLFIHACVAYSTEF